MVRVNSQVIGNISCYKNRLDTNVNGILQQLKNGYYSVDLYQELNFKSYCLISENIRMDLNYLPTLDMRFNRFGFLGMQRNIRNSIEMFYDLYNLTYVPDYASVLKCASEYAVADSNDYKNVENISKKYQFKIKKNNRGKVIISIKDKAKIAKCANLSEEIYSKLKNISMEANSFVHPDIFYVDMIDPAIRLWELLEVETILLAHSHKLLVDRINNIYLTNYSYDPYIEYNQLWSALRGINGCFVVN